GRERPALLRAGVRRLLAAGGPAECAGEPRAPLRCAAGVQPAGHVLAAGSHLEAARPAVRVRPARPLPRGVRGALRQARLLAPGTAVAGAAHLSGRRPGDLSEPVLPR